MPDARGVVRRLRERPRVSYAEPQDDEIDTALTGGAEENDLGDNDFDLSHSKSAKKKATSKKAKDPKKAQHFRFLELPAELRNMIYELTLVHDSYPINLRVKKWKFLNVITCIRYLHNTTLSPNLLLLNKATYKEAAPILYQNDFEFADPRALYLFMMTIGTDAKAWVKSVSVSSRGGSTVTKGYLCPAFNSLIGAASLKRLHLEYTVGREDGGRDDIADRIFRNAHIWIQAVGREQGDKAAALDLLDVNLTGRLSNGASGQAKQLRERMRCWLT